MRNQQWRSSWLALGLGVALLAGYGVLPNLAADPVNVAKGSPGELPKGDDGHTLNLDFETGTLADWTATGQAFAQQPIKGPIDQTRIYGEGKFSAHTGQYWIGGFERLHDEPVGTLTSAAFTITQPFASFLVGGGAHKETRVELVLVEGDKVIYTTSGRNEENMRPVVVNLNDHLGKKMFVRIVDEQTGGWGHVNFDDFRLHAKRPEFAPPRIPPSADLLQLYPHAGLDPQAAAAAMQVPAGFKVQVGAAEPDVQQPVAMALDDRGRVWIAEAYEYPRRAKEDGRDRILVFEDTNGDGSLDKRTVFAENLNLVSGLEVGFGGVWVGAAPHLLFIPDRNRDDRPDGPPEVLLDGWGYEDTHETLNSFIWGPDGWLYGCHGVFTHSAVGKPGTPKEERIRINAGIWRYHPTRHVFEIFAEGTSNPWGVDFDDHGQAFATACVIPHLFHIVQGARYERQAGEHFNKHTYDDIKTIADHRHYTGNQWNNNDRRSSDSLGGGHAHAGAMIYLGDAWPKNFRHQLFMNNIHGNRMNVDVLKREGSGFVGSHGEDFLLTRDQWSQMLYMTYGPDGNVWVIDWYDATQCHRNEPEIPDRTNGRIYRIVYSADAATGGAPAIPRAPAQVDVSTASNDQLVAWQSHPNDWYVRHARRVLQERAAAGKLDAQTADALAQLALSAPETRLRLRGLWALHAVGGLTDSLAQKLLASDRPEVRAWTIQLAAEPPADAAAAGTVSKSTGAVALGSSPELLKQLVRAAHADESPMVRLYILSALQRLPVAQRWDALTELVKHAEDAEDHNLPLMLWYAAEPLAAADPGRALQWGIAAGKQFPRLRDYMIRRIASEGHAESLALLVDGLNKTQDTALQLSYLTGINTALVGKTKVDAPAAWSTVFPQLSRSDNADVRLQSLVLGATFADPAALTVLRTSLTDAQLPVNARRQALVALLKVKDTGLPGILRGLLGDAALRSDVLRGLAAFDDPETPRAVLSIYASLSLGEQRDAIATLSSRVSYATALMQAVEKKQIPTNHLTAEMIRQLVNLKDEALVKQIERVWGTYRELSADRAALIAHYKQLITEPLPAGIAPRNPDPDLGRAVFVKVCAQCHTLFGKGGKVGPDLTGSNRANLDYLLSNVLDPSAVMAKEYQPTIVVTNNGRVLTGIVKAETPDAITLQTATEIVVVPAADIDERKPSEKSMMPDDLLKNLQPHEVRGLVTYLGGAGQTPVLATDDTLKSFFNGQDLTGWVGNEQLWSVEKGEIVGRTTGLKHNEFLVSELAVENFRLTLEVKLTPNAENSGIQFRSQPLAGGEVKGYQADIGQGWWGKLYEELGRGLIWKESGEAHVQPNDWNKYEIVAVGSRVRTWINGKPCVDLDDSAGARRGVIALQLHAGGALEVRFRKLRLDRLPTSAAPAPGTPYPTSLGGPTPSRAISFVRRQLDPRFRSEGVAYGDFNNDGLLDIAAGSVWYEAPDWTMHTLLEKPNEFNIRTYGDTFCNWAEDVDGDGRQDLVVVDFPGKPTWWFKNPGDGKSVWTRHQITPVTNNESPTFVDLDRDGRRELLCGFAGGRLGIVRPGPDADGEWKMTNISGASAPGTDKFSHGLGVGDLNGDGRDDVLVTAGWWEAPPPGQGDAEWKFHAAPFGEPCSQMYVFDFDGDGDQDVVSTSAHRAGLWWHERQGPDEWATHEVDKSIAQTHAMVMADINGDGLPDLVTGKRYYAHNGNDPGEDEPPLLAWYELSRQDGRAQWTRHVIDEDSGVGTQFEVVDMNADGLLDIVVANKHGVYYFQQQRK